LDEKAKSAHWKEFLDQASERYLWKAASYMGPRDSYGNIPTLKADSKEVSDNHDKARVFRETFFPKMAEPNKETPIPRREEIPWEPITELEVEKALRAAKGTTARVLQSAEPKEAVVQREPLEFMSHEATEMRLAVSGTIWTRSSAENAVVVLSHTWLTASSSHGAENNGARQQRRRRAVGETRVRGSPRLTSATPDQGEHRRPILTRQNRKGNVASTCPECCPPPFPTDTTWPVKETPRWDRRVPGAHSGAWAHSGVRRPYQRGHINSLLA
jgi:hypothetical protein